MMHCIRAQDPAFWESILTLADRAEWMSACHTRSALHYYREQHEESSRIADESFVIKMDDMPLIGIIAQQIDSGSGKSLCAFNNPMVCLEDPMRTSVKARRLFLEEFDRIASQAGADIHFRDQMSAGKVSFLTRHLLAHGALISPVLTRIIDLQDSEAELKRTIRKSYKSLLNWGERELQPVILDSTNMTQADMDVFRLLHAEVAGRQTRSEESWRRQYLMIESGEGFVVAGRIDGELVSAGMFFMSKHNCYYGSSASRRDLFEKPIFHSLLWKAILHARNTGCRWFNVGEEMYPNHPPGRTISPKEANISAFKTGFGGVTTAHLDVNLKSMEHQNAR